MKIEPSPQDSRSDAASCRYGKSMEENAVAVSSVALRSWKVLGKAS